MILISVRQRTYIAVVDSYIAAQDEHATAATELQHIYSGLYGNVCTNMCSTEEVWQAEEEEESASGASRAYSMRTNM